MLILASQSPRRRELLANAGIRFEVRIVPVDESVEDGEAPQSYVRRIAARKAAAAKPGPEDAILAADTTVVVDGQIFGKPVDAADAVRMLRVLAGRSHEVITGICLRHKGSMWIDAAVTRVEFASMSDEEIRAYVATGEPMDKAGAYGIQGVASRYVTQIEGCYFNVVGLPVSLVCRYLSKAGLL